MGVISVVPTFTFECYCPHRRRKPNQQFYFPVSNHAEDIAMVRNQGFSVDDDNEPVEENIPTAETPEARGSNLLPGQQWGWDGINRMKTVHPDKEMSSFKRGWSIGSKSYLEI